MVNLRRFSSANAGAIGFKAVAQANVRCNTQIYFQTKPVIRRKPERQAIEPASAGQDYD
jgi:hypothetical protein